MIKIKNCSPKFKVLFWIFLVLTFNFSLLTFNLSAAKAQSPTPTPQDEEVKGLRDAIKKIVREKLEQTQKGQKRGLAGEIREITNLTLTLTTNQGERQVNIATDTAIIGKGAKKMELKDLKIGSFAIAMGYIIEGETLEARRLVLSEKPKSPAREVAFGKVTDISSVEKILTVKNEKKGVTYTVEVTNKTVITKKIDTKIQKVKFSDIEKGDRVVAIGTPTENETKLITAKLIHVIPGKAIGQETPTPSP